jgi:hypothetical protein
VRNHQHHNIQVESMANVDRSDQVAHMGRVEGAAEEADSANDGLGHPCSLRKPCFYPSLNDLQPEANSANPQSPMKANARMEIKVSRNLF